MFKDKNTQYINIKQYDKQLKIDNQVLKSDKIIKTEHSSFLVDDKMSQDVVDKLNILQKNIKKTYLTTVCDSVNQKIVDNNFVDNNFVVRKLAPYLQIAIPKPDILSTQNYFSLTGIDYIFSPFNILYNYLASHKPNTNSLNILVLNNIIYSIVLNSDHKIVFSSIKTLTSFENIHKSEFYTQGIQGQQLFDDIHFLEVEDAINEITNEFYSQSIDETFCESVSICYTIKQLSQEQLKQIEEKIMLEVEYSMISIEENLFLLAKHQHSKEHSFINPRKKPKTKKFLIWIIGVIVSTLLAIGVFMLFQNYKQDELLEIQKSKKLKAQALKKAQASKIKLPNHRMINDKTINTIADIFNLIPDDGLLSELQLQEDESTIVANFLQKDAFDKQIKPKLLKLYDVSELLLIQYDKPVYNMIISSSKLKPQKILKKQIQPKYTKGKLISKNKIIKKLKSILPKETKIVFKSKKNGKFLTYNFEISTIFKDPKEFFDFVDKLNKDKYCANIIYPIEFAYVPNGVDLIFNLQFHQVKRKKSVK